MFKGSIPALVTPMRNGSLDENAFRAFVDWQIREGTNGLVPVGTTGESPTLSHDEHRRVVEALHRGRRRAACRSSPAPARTTRGGGRARHACREGRRRRACWSSRPTTTSRPSAASMRISAPSPRRSTLPIIIYNIPPRSVIDMSVETMGSSGARLQEHRRRQGRDRQARARPQQRMHLRHGFRPALGRGRHGARLQRAWRRRLHLGDRQCRAAALRRIPGGDPRRRLCQGARSSRTG